MRRAELARELGTAFTVSGALRAGTSPSRLRAADLEAPFRGLRVTSSHGGDFDGSEHERARHAIMRQAELFAMLMSDEQFLTHVTAAIGWGMPLPRQLVDPERGLDVGVFAPHRHPRRRGVVGHQVQPGYAHVVEHPERGLRMASPASTWAMLGAVIRDPHDLVAAADALVREPMFHGDPPPLATVEQLRAALAVGRRVGGPALRAAVERVRTRSASRTETRCRLVLVDYGLPEPDLNVAVYDPSGRLVAVVDLAYPLLKIAIEYEGEHHLLDPVQWAKDIARHEELAAMGWIVIRVTKEQLFGAPAQLVARVRRAIRSRTWA
ncbi:MAG: DUF559 domain-containing protein [Microbacterium sp.]|uniref:endonuclease domain-containing protein n=1 Tax=Microbacterium sp. TaxID=51671 RepID=UPI0039E28698